MSVRAAFLDRDGTIVVDHHFIARPEQVQLLPKAGSAVRRLNEDGWLVVLVTNQSGIARGLFTLADYERVHARMLELLAAEGARIDAAYMCPHHPDFTGPCECRKPGTLMFRQAAAAYDIDLGQSWLVGDKLRDVTPARELGARGAIMTPNPETPVADLERARRDFGVAPSLAEAVDRIIQSAGK